jgi:hypothetical protein
VVEEAVDLYAPARLAVGLDDAGVLVDTRMRA